MAGVSPNQYIFNFGRGPYSIGGRPPVGARIYYSINSYQGLIGFRAGLVHSTLALGIGEGKIATAFLKLKNSEL